MEATEGEVKIEIDETNCDDEFLNENELAMWYLDNPFKTHAEEKFVEHVHDPLNLIQRKKNYVAEGYKDPGMQEWEKELSEMIYKNDKNWFCKFCDYKHHHRGYAMSHVETYHPPNNFPCYKCLKCGVKVANRLNFQVHISKVHASDQPATNSNKRVETAPKISSLQATDMTENTIKYAITDRWSELGSGIKEETKNVDENHVSCIDEQLKTPEMKEWNEEVNSMTYRLDKVWICKKCNYQHFRKGYVMNHIEAKHPSEVFPGYKCLKCCAKIKTRMSFLVHVTKCQRNKDERLNESNSVGDVVVENPQIFFKVFPNHPSYKSSILKSATQIENSKHLLIESVPENELSNSLLVKNSLLTKSVPENENSKHLLFLKKRLPQVCCQKKDLKNK
jgi:rubrerythrin